jgi:predicted RNase H-like nuclease (RuvC/YqgF family)
MSLPADIERIREFKKTVESLAAEISQVDNQVLHEVKGTREINTEERRRVRKLANELKQMEEVDQ